MHPLTHIPVFTQALKGSSNPKILCIVGSGILARSHAEAMKLICQFDEVGVLVLKIITRILKISSAVYTCSSVLPRAHRTLGSFTTR